MTHPAHEFLQLYVRRDEGVPGMAEIVKVGVGQLGVRQPAVCHSRLKLLLRRVAPLGPTKIRPVNFEHGLA